MARKLIMFGCDYCKELRKTDKGIKNHEAKCFLNPATRSCLTCKSFHKGRGDLDDQRRTRKCKKLINLSECLYSDCTNWEKKNEDDF